MKFAAVMCAPLTPRTTALPGACVHDCAECRVPCVCRDTCPEWLPKLCVACCAALLLDKPDADIMTPSGVGSIFAVQT